MSRTAVRERTFDLPVRVGVSSCLLGEKVRYDGGHKRDAFLVQELGRHVEWVSVCPELEVGMGVPREAVRLLRTAGESSESSIRMVGEQSGKDWTDAMSMFSEARARSLEQLELSGYILKSKSPSCGLERVKVYSSSGIPSKTGQGLFARALMERFPLLPVEDEARLYDHRLRENFLERVFCHHRWLLFRKARFSARRLLEFHLGHKYLLLAHSGRHLRELERLVARAANKGQLPGQEAADRYARGFFDALKILPTVKTHVNVLQRISRSFKDGLGSAEREELLVAMERFRRGLVPRLVPVTLIHHHLRRLKIRCIEGQFYLSPHPKELLLKYDS